MLRWNPVLSSYCCATLSAALFWFYWRDMQRAPGTQAFFAALTRGCAPLTSVRLQSEAIAAGEPTQELVDRLLADTHRLSPRSTRHWSWRVEGGGALAEQAIGWIRGWTGCCAIVAAEQCACSLS
jgi:hypothetical protein